MLMQIHRIRKLILLLVNGHNDLKKSKGQDKDEGDPEGHSL